MDPQFHTNILWCIHTQCRLLDEFDAWFIQAIAAGAPDSLATTSFLKKYQLLRGHTAILFQDPDNVGHFSTIAHNHFGLLQHNCGYQSLTRAWNNAMNEFYADGQYLLLPSAYLKLLWFYRPECATMYDQRVHRGLRLVERALGIHNPAPPTIHNYLERFEAIFDQLQCCIEAIVHEYFRIYPYTRRILDKYLWLIGQNDQGASLIATFNHLDGLAIAPLQQAPG